MLKACQGTSFGEALPCPQVKAHHFNELGSEARLLVSLKRSNPGLAGLQNHGPMHGSFFFLKKLDLKIFCPVPLLYDTSLALRLSQAPGQLLALVPLVAFNNRA